MRAGRIDEAVGSFRKALTFYPENASANLGLADALRAAGQRVESDACRAAAAATIPTVERTRPLYAAMVQAEMLAADGQSDAAADVLTAALTGAPRGFACWSIPIEPAFRQVIASASFAPFLEALEHRAH